MKTKNLQEDARIDSTPQENNEKAELHQVMSEMPSRASSQVAEENFTEKIDSVNFASDGSQKNSDSTEQKQTISQDSLLSPDSSINPTQQQRHRMPQQRYAGGNRDREKHQAPSLETHPQDSQNQRRNQQHSGISRARDNQQNRSYQQRHHSARSGENIRPGEQNQQYQKPVLEELSLNDLIGYARRFGIIGTNFMSKDALVQKIRFMEAHPDHEIEVGGVLEKLPDGFGFLRSAQFDYFSSSDDIYVSPSQIRRFNLKTGDTIQGTIRRPKDGEKYFALLKVNQVNFAQPSLAIDRPVFDHLTPLHPNKRLSLENEPTVVSTRILDIFAPIGKGQRGLIVAPPKVGKTVLLKEIAVSLTVNHPDAYLIVLLVDERPEEVADMKRTVKGVHTEVVSSTFDEAAERHVQVAEIVLEKAKRLVESGKDVIILLDSLTRLARAYNTTAPASGKVLTGGIDANALQRPKRFFGAARNTEEAGSLTIIASALVETGSRMDEVIYEEFKGTGNMEIHMTRKLSNRRTYPAFDLLQSGTRRDDLLLTEEELNKVWVLQKFLATMNTVEGMEFLIEKMKKTKNNKEFFESINKKNGSGDK